MGRSVKPEPKSADDAIVAFFERVVEWIELRLDRTLPSILRDAGIAAILGLIGVAIVILQDQDFLSMIIFIPASATVASGIWSALPEYTKDTAQPFDSRLSQKYRRRALTTRMAYRIARLAMIAFGSLTAVSLATNFLPGQQVSLPNIAYGAMLASTLIYQYLLCVVPKTPLQKGRGRQQNDFGRDPGDLTPAFAGAR